MERCTEQQSLQISIPLLTEAQEGLLAPQSAHTDKGCRGFGLLNIFHVILSLKVIIQAV